MFKLVVVILCFATLLVSTTGSALKKDEYEISIKHDSFAVHQRHVNADKAAPRETGTSHSVPQAPTVALAPSGENGQRNELESPPGGGDKGSVSPPAGGENGDGERLSTTLAVPRPTVQSASEVSSGKNIDFAAVSPGLEEMPLQRTVFQRGQGASSSYQSLELDFDADPADEREAIVKPISAQDFYNTPQLRERGPVLFSTEPTTTTTSATTTGVTTAAQPPGKLYKSIPKSAVEQNEEVYLLLKYENPRKNTEANGQSGGGTSLSEGKELENERVRPSGSRGRPQAEVTTKDNFVEEGLRAGGSFTTVGYFVSDAEPTTTPMAPVSTSNKLRNSYGDFLSGDFKDFEDSIRPIEENGEDLDAGAEEADGSTTPEDIDANLDIGEMTRILAGRQGGLTIAEFNKLFKDYLKKEITAGDLEDFARLEAEATDAPATAASTATDPTKSFDIRAENGKKSLKTGNGLVGPNAAQKLQLEMLKVLINRPPGKAGVGGRKEKLVKIGYGGSKSFQGVYKSPKFLEKLKAERTPLPSDAAWAGHGYARQPQPMREIGPMAYVDNPVFAHFRPAGARPRVGAVAEGLSAGNVGQSYVKFQKIS